MENQSTTASLPTLARAWLAVGFAAVAIAAVMSNAQAFSPASEASASGATGVQSAPLSELSDRVDWNKLPMSNITPAETVAAYDR